MKEEFTFYVGVDWGVECMPGPLCSMRRWQIFSPCASRMQAWWNLEFCDFLQALTNGEASALAVAIEVG
jgi:hypothetical protein